METADVIVVNGKIRTMEAGQATAEALAIKDGRILAVGRSSEIENLVGPSTERIDACGNLVLPGFQDAHIHYQLSSADLYHSADLSGAHNLDDLLATIKIYAEQQPGKAWIRGQGYSSAEFTSDMLTKEALDSVTGGRPAFMIASDYHNGWANSAAFALAGVTPGSPEPTNGYYLRLPDGSPKGDIIEDAIWAMNAVAPGYSKADYLAGMAYYSNVFNSYGITAVLDAMTPRGYLENYQELSDRGELNLRVSATSKIFAHKGLEEQLEELKDLRRTYNGDRVSLYSAKFFLDGVAENGTAVFIEPRCDDGKNAELMFGQEQIDTYFAAFDKEKFNLHVHTIGDGATRAALDGFEYARRQNGTWDSRHQCAHLQVVDEADVKRFADLGAVGNFQTLWAQPEDPLDRIMTGILGPKRSERIYPIGDFVREGVTCALGSDWGVSTFDPFKIMQTAVTRQKSGADETSPAQTPQHRIDIETAVKGYTINAAYAAWRDDVTGSLTAGKYADLIVLDQDLFSISPYDIEKTQVLLTLLEGKEVFRHASFS